jgi:hypothetical protein
MKIAALVIAAGVAAGGSLPRPATPEETAVVAEAVRHRLKDPDSMQLENVRVGPGKTAGSLTVCGEVNARNAMGGYVGMRTFYAMYVLENKVGKPAAVVIGIDDARANVAQEWCAKAGM